MYTPSLSGISGSSMWKKMKLQDCWWKNLEIIASGKWHRSYNLVFTEFMVWSKSERGAKEGNNFFFFTFWSCKTKIVVVQQKVLQCYIGYGNSRNEKKIEESKIFYDRKPFSLDQGYVNPTFVGVIALIFSLYNFTHTSLYSFYLQANISKLTSGADQQTGNVLAKNYMLI